MLLLLKNIILLADWVMQLPRLPQNIFPVPIEYVGTKDTFGESGKPKDLLKKYGLDIPDIVAAAEKVIAIEKRMGKVCC